MEPRGVVDFDAVTRLATLPSRDVLLGQLAGGFASPLSTMAGLLSAPLRNLGYIEAARLRGAHWPTIVFRELMPNVLPELVVEFCLRYAYALLLISSLGFLGFGVQPPTPTWGAMLSEGRNFMVDAWWLALLPGLAITFVIMSGNLFGDWLRDITDPRLRQG